MIGEYQCATGEGDYLQVETRKDGTALVSRDDAIAAWNRRPEPELPEGCEWVGTTLTHRSSELRVYLGGDGALVIDDGNVVEVPADMVRAVLARHEREVGR